MTTGVRPVRRRVALLAFALVGAACTTGESIGMSMRGGDTRDEVERMLGRPDGYRRQGNTEALTYANRLISGWGWDRADYIVIFTDGHVSSNGPGAIRQGQGPMVGTLVLTPLR